MAELQLHNPGKFTASDATRQSNLEVPEVPYDGETEKYANIKNSSACRSTQIKYSLRICNPEIAKDRRAVVDCANHFSQVTRLEACRDEDIFEMGFETEHALYEAYKLPLLYKFKRVVKFKPCDENELPAILNISSLPSTLSLETLREELYMSAGNYGKIVAATVNRSMFASDVALGKATIILAQCDKQPRKVPSLAYLSSAEEVFEISQFDSNLCKYCGRFDLKRWFHTCPGLAKNVPKWGK